MPKRQSGFAHIIVLIIVLVGIGVGLYLVQHPQIFKPKAAETPDISFESHYNPFGDPWYTNTGPNPAIPVGLTTGCYRRGPKATAPVEVSDQEIAYLTKSNTPVIFEECAIVQGPTGRLNRPHLTSIGTKLKQVNPNAKYLGYTVFYFADLNDGLTGDILVRANSGLNCGSVTCESMLVHKRDMPATASNRLGKYLDITNPNYQQYIADQMAQALTDMNMDGFLADAVGPSFPGGSAAPDTVLNNWSSSWGSLMRQVKAAIGPNKLIFVNSGGQSNAFIQSVLQSNGADGFMWEDPLGPIGLDFQGSGRMAELNSKLNLATSLNKYMMIAVNTNVNCGISSPVDYCFRNTNKQREQAFSRYYLSAFLNFFANSKTFLIYYNPISTSPQFDAEAFFRDWTIKIGSPTSGSQEISDGVYLRTFQKAYVYWNNSNSNYAIPGGSGLYAIPEGVDISGQVVPAKSGRMFVTGDLLQSYNNPPSPPASPSPSPSPSPNALPTPGPFTLNPLTTFCSGTNSHVRLSWTASANGPSTTTNSGYFVYIDGVYKFNNLQSLTMDDPEAKTYGQSYKYKIEAVVLPNGRTFSNEQTVVAKNCAASPSPSASPSRSPSPSPSPSPVLSPSPSPSKPGDGDGDGDVDIFDYNLVVTNFGRTGTNIPGDVDKNGKVDIFDYNLVVTNFGR